MRDLHLNLKPVQDVETGRKGAGEAKVPGCTFVSERERGVGREEKERTTGRTFISKKVFAGSHTAEEWLLGLAPGDC